MIVCYTAIFGASDRLKPAPVGPDQCVCFTDDPRLGGRGWTMVVRPPVDWPRRSARAVKLTPHRLFPDADHSVWIDGSMNVADWPALMRDSADAELACFAHPDRSTCYAEGETVIRLQIADPDRVREALAGYQADGFRPTTLSTTGLLIRRHSARMAAFNDLWHDQLDRFGTNDQLHVDYCAWRSGIAVTYLPGHYRANRYVVYDQADHHRRRQPQFRPVRDCA